MSVPTTTTGAASSARNKRVTLEQIWPSLETGVGTLINDLDKGVRMDSKEFMDLYTAVYNYCTTTKTAGRQGGKGVSGANFVGEELYERLNAYLIAHMNGVRTAAEQHVDESLLRFYFKEWVRFTQALRYINHIFQYLNRHWIKREAEDGKKEVYEVKYLGLVVWRDYAFNDIKPRLNKALFEMLERERNGEEIDRTVTRGIIEGFVKLGLNRERPEETSLDVYQESFEAPFLEMTRSFYTKESALFIAENSVSDYLKKVAARLQQEKQRTAAYLHPSTESLLTLVCEKVLIERHLEAIQGEFVSFLRQDKVDDLKCMFSLLARVPSGLDPLRTQCEEFIHSTGLSEMQQVAKDAAKPQAYVEAVLRVWRKYSELIAAAFHSDAGFVASLDKACRRFINNNAVTQDNESGAPSKSPELLARYCDQLLRKGEKGVTETDIDKTLDDILIVFKYIEEKDVFLIIYSKTLSKRLIGETSLSEDLEASMIGKLKAISGFDYTTKLQRMFADVGTSRELNARFAAGQVAMGISGGGTSFSKVDASVLVLATGSWPLQPPTCEFTVPRDIAPFQSAFERFYMEQHSGRKLLWLPQLSKGEVKAHYLSKAYTLQCSAYQIGVLLMFEDGVSFSLQQISIATQLREDALKNTMYALVKTRTLLMTPAPESISDPIIGDDASFALNRKFSSKRLKVNINISNKGAKKKETQTVNKEISEDRKLAIQACIVRIMKARKRLPHAQLVTEVVTQLNQRFKPKVPLIKKCVDVLLDKEYLRRAESNVNEYEMNLSLKLDFGAVGGGANEYLRLESEMNGGGDNNYVRTVQWSADGSRFIGVCRDNVVRMCSLPQDYMVGQVPTVVTPWNSYCNVQCPATVYDLAWYPWMSASNPPTCCFLLTGKAAPIHLKCAFTGATRASYVAFDQNDEPESCLSTCWSRDGTRLYGGCEGTIHVWDVQRPGRILSQWDVLRSKVDGDAVSPHRPFRGLVSCLEWSPDGSMLAAGSYGGNVAIYNGSGECIYMLKKAQPKGVTQVKWSLDGTVLYIGGRKSANIVAYDMRLVARNPKGCIPLVRFERHAYTFQRIKFDLVGRSHLVSGSSDSTSLNVYDVVDGSLVTQMALHKDVISSVSIHPTLPLLLTGSGQRRSLLSDEISENAISLWTVDHCWNEIQ